MIETCDTIYFIPIGIGIVLGLVLARAFRKKDDWSDIYEYL